MTRVAHARRQLAFPVLFVLLWSTGFIAAKYGLPYAPPLTFLLYRFALVAALMTVVALATRATWPDTLAQADTSPSRRGSSTAPISAASSSRSRAACRPGPPRCWSGCSRCSRS